MEGLGGTISKGREEKKEDSEGKARAVRETQENGAMEARERVFERRPC